MLVTITLGLLVAFILKESAAELAPLPEEFFFVFSLYPHLVHLLSLPSFAPLSCPSLEQFPVQLEQSRELLAGLVEDETGQTRLIAYLIFVIFFTRAKFLENKIYTEKHHFFA